MLDGEPPRWARSTAFGTWAEHGLEEMTLHMALSSGYGHFGILIRGRWKKILKGLGINQLEASYLAEILASAKSCSRLDEIQHVIFGSGFEPHCHPTGLTKTTACGRLIGVLLNHVLDALKTLDRASTSFKQLFSNRSLRFQFEMPAIAESFVKDFYAHISGAARAAGVHSLYRPESTVTWEGIQFKGAEAILEELKRPDLRVGKHTISSLDCQHGHAGSLQVLITGLVVVNGDEKKFVESFTLAPGQAGGLFIQNQLFRYTT